MVLVERREGGWVVLVERGLLKRWVGGLGYLGWVVGLLHGILNCLNTPPKLFLCSGVPESKLVLVVFGGKGGGEVVGGVRGGVSGHWGERRRGGSGRCKWSLGEDWGKMRKRGDVGSLMSWGNIYKKSYKTCYES